MNVMRGNMSMMAERDSNLRDLSQKSSAFHSTSNAFNRQAQHLQWEMRWQKIRLAFLACFLVLWAVLFYVFRRRKLIYSTVSGFVLVVVFLMERCMVRRWRSTEAQFGGDGDGL